VKINNDITSLAYRVEELERQVKGLPQLVAQATNLVAQYNTKPEFPIGQRVRIRGSHYHYPYVSLWSTSTDPIIGNEVTIEGVLESASSDQDGVRVTIGGVLFRDVTFL
jgi:hypothetical protein